MNLFKSQKKKRINKLKKKNFQIHNVNMEIVIVYTSVVQERIPFYLSR